MVRTRDSRVSRLPLPLRRAALRISSTFYRFPAENQGLWPVDLWQGDAESGKHIAHRRFILADCDITFSRHMAWYAREATPSWLRELHGFGWLRDFAAAQGIRNGGKRVRNLVEDWLNCRASLHETAFEPAVTGERLSHWIYYAPYLAQSGSPAFQRRILRHMQSEFFVLYQLAVRGRRAGFSALKGAMVAALTLPGCRFAYPLVRGRLAEYLQWLMEGEGRLLERSVTELHRILRGLLEIAAVQALYLDAPDETLREAIADLALSVDTLRHGDGSFIVFNGSLEGEAEAMRETLRLAEYAARQMENPSLLNRNGYARIDAGGSRVFMDVASPLVRGSGRFNGAQAFEWSHGENRIVVNCGAYVGMDAGWQSAVRQSAAHSTLSPSAADSTDAQLTVVSRQAMRDGYVFLEGTAEGYLSLQGAIYQRQLLINDSGTRFSGADSLQLEVGGGFNVPIDIHLRFHLHPDVKVKRLMNGLVILQSGVSGAEEWMFQSSVGQAVEVSDSVYLGCGGKPRASKQIVIYAPLSPDLHSPETGWSVEWSFIRN